MRNDVERILYSKEQIDKRVKELGAQITEDYRDKNPMFVGILKGSFVFMADLVRNVDTMCDLEFMAVSSYGDGTSTTGAVKIKMDLSHDIEGRDVIIVEDILDSGVTLNYLKGYLAMRKPNSIKICTMLDKKERRTANITADYVGFECPNEFIVGYGLDYAQKYRNLPEIGILKREIYE